MAYYQQTSHQHQHLFSKNHRLYQQLLQNDFPSASPYSSSQQPSHAATIKFARPAPTVGITREPQYAQERQQFSPKLPRNGGLFKMFEPSVGRMSNQATQSLSSNYCITENENEENSTVNLYSLSRNHIEPDLDLSHSPTAHINPEDSLPHHNNSFNQAQPIQNDGPILEASLLNNNTLEQQESSVMESDNIKKYRSEEYSHLPFTPEEEEQEGKVPKVLAEKYLKNDITKKFSTGHNSEYDSQSNFKTVLNEIHVVPYRINNQLKPYTYSIPIDNRNYSAMQNGTITSSIPDRRGKANSLNLKYSNHSHHSGQEEEVATTPVRHLYFSNHTHLNPTRQPYIAQSPYSEAPKIRQTPRSQPKYNNSNNQRNNRSNSIECKTKPNINIAQQNEYLRNPEVPRQHLDQSQVTKLFKNVNYPQEQNLIPQESSVIYESTGLNVCCSLTRNGDQPNKINFMPRPKDQLKKDQGKNKGDESISPFFCSSIDMTKATPLQNPKGTYKINPIQMIRDLSQPESQRGIKLIGFPSKRDKL